MRQNAQDQLEPRFRVGADESHGNDGLRPPAVSFGMRYPRHNSTGGLHPIKDDAYHADMKRQLRDGIGLGQAGIASGKQPEDTAWNSI